MPNHHAIIIFRHQNLKKKKTQLYWLEKPGEKKKKTERNSAKPYQKKRNKTKPFIFGQRVTGKKKEMMSV